MKFKELIKQSYEDLKNLTINWFNVLSLTVIIFILNNIVTPLIGIPVGLLGGAYILKRREEKINNHNAKALNREVSVTSLLRASLHYKFIYL